MPVGFLPLPVAALAFAAMTAALLVCGIAALRTASRWPLVAIAALSVVVLAGLVGSRTIQKAAATERTFDKVSITTEVTDRMTRQLDGVTGFLAAHRDELVPATAAELGVAPQSMADQLDAAFPAAAALRSAPGSAALDHIGDSVAFRRGNVSNYETVKALPVSALMWASTGLWALVAAASVARSPFTVPHGTRHRTNGLAARSAASDQGFSGDQQRLFFSRMLIVQAEPRPMTWARPTLAPSTCRAPASPRRWQATS